QVLVLVNRVAVDEPDPELSSSRVDGRLRPLAVAAVAAEEEAERAAAGDVSRRRPRPGLVIGVTQEDLCAAGAGEQRAGHVESIDADHGWIARRRCVRQWCEAGGGHTGRPASCGDPL